MFIIQSQIISQKIREYIAEWRRHAEYRFNVTLDRCLTASVDWLLSRYTVQRAIVKVFEDHATPMCRALDDAIEQKVDEAHQSIDADNIDGLEKLIENVVEEELRNFKHDLSAEDIEDFDEAVEQIVDGKSLQESIEENVKERVIEELVNRLKG